MARTETLYHVYRNTPKNAAGYQFAIRIAEGFTTLNQAKTAIIDREAVYPGGYFVRKVVTTDYSAEDLNMIDDQS